MEGSLSSIIEFAWPTVLLTRIPLSLVLLRPRRGRQLAAFG
jgi:hypothetical protein